MSFEISLVSSFDLTGKMSSSLETIMEVSMTSSQQFYLYGGRSSPNDSEGSMSGHVARRARMDALMSTSAQATPRSVSWSRTKTPGHQTQRTTVRSVSVSRVKPRDDTKEKEQQEMARAAFQEWLKRKSKEPRGPKASPSREQITQHLKDDLKHRIYNTWLNNPKFEKKVMNGGGCNGDVDH